MVGVKIKTRDETRRVRAKAQKANIMSLGHAGATLRLVARRSIRRSSRPSAPGMPPHTRRGALRNAIVFAVEKDQKRVTIGPEFQGVGTSAMAHEFGGPYKRQRYPARPFMGPALDKIKDRLPRMWAASVR